MQDILELQGRSMLKRVTKRLKVGARKAVGSASSDTIFTLPADSHRMLLSLVDKNAAGGHWLYTGHRTSKGGYGSFAFRRKDGRLVFVNVHRYVYEHYHRVKIKRGYELDHLCHVTNCCNPVKPHIEQVTKKVNLARRRFH